MPKEGLIAKRPGEREGGSKASEIGLVNGLTNGVEPPLIEPQIQTKSPEEISVGPKKTPYGELAEKYLKGRMFGSLKMSELQNIKEKFAGREINDAEQAFLHRLNITEIIKKYNITDATIKETPHEAVDALDKEFEGGGHLLKLHAPNYYVDAQPFFKRLKGLTGYKG